MLNLYKPAAAADVKESKSLTTLVLFSDRPMPERQWTALAASLQQGLAQGDTETDRLDRNPVILRGDKVVPGLSVESAIVVYLHGDCELQPLVRRTAFGVPLGWVLERQGRIDPFVHVDCTRIGQVLGPKAWGVSRDRRTGIMAAAIARVILHEWIHIAEQSSQHAEEGIEKAQFGISDLTEGSVSPSSRSRNSPLGAGR
jgi:hypothetical protein